MKLVQDLPEIFEEFGEKKREAFLEIKEYKDKGIPVKMSKTPGTIRMMPPTQGQHTDEVLKSVGYTDEQLQHMRQDGVIL